MAGKGGFLEMNIKQHIEAGHYPKDEKGRALVPMRRGETAVILATDAPGSHPIIGMVHLKTGETAVHLLTPDGAVFSTSMSQSDLLPPPPRKVEVKARIECTPEGFTIRHLAKADGGGFQHGEMIELTGSYEMPWD